MGDFATAWNAMRMIAVLAAVYLLWDQLYARLRDRSVLRSILAGERKPELLTRGVLIAKLVRRSLSALSAIFLILPVLRFLIRGNTVLNQTFVYFSLPAAAALFMLYLDLKYIRAINTGDFQFRCLVFSGTKTEGSPGKYSRTITYFGIMPGDHSVEVSPLFADVGHRQYVLVFQGTGILLLREDQWQPDDDLLQLIPASDTASSPENS